VKTGRQTTSFVIFLVLAAIAVNLLAAEPSRQTAESKPLLRFEESLDSMGTTFTVVVYGTDRFKLQAAVDSAFEEVRRLEDLLSNYRQQSEWSEMNRSAAGRPFRVSKEVFDLLSLCMRYSEASEGAFDITVGPLMQVWGFYKGTGRFPHRAEIKGALAQVGYRKVELDPGGMTVNFKAGGMNLDPGGIGKGYSVDRMVAILRENGIGSGLITAGSSSIYAIGAPPSEPRGWRVAIRHPKDGSKTVQEVFLKDESMSTSGSYEKFFRANGRVYSHIMDPRTGYPAQGMLSVSVIAPRTIDSEAWTKPYFINGRDWASAHKQKGSRVYLCEDRTEPSCAWLQ
jgi:thiamine biosynthesis lipoprotein